MSFIAFSSFLSKLAKLVLSILPLFFILLLTFGFNESHIAWITISSALIHEIGHILCILSIGKSRIKIKAVLSGFRIANNLNLSYDELIKVYLAGPATNLFVFVCSSLLSPILGEIASLVSIINLATALSNLLPIRGYDGYGILQTVIEKHAIGEWATNTLTGISTTLTLLFCIISLYFIDRMGGGYWIFAIFFLSMIKCIKSGLGE